MVRREGMQERPGFHAELVKQSAEVTVLDVAGEIDLYTSPKVESLLDAAVGQGVAQIVIDLSKVTFLDSSGLGALVHGKRIADPAGSTLTIVCDRPNLLRTLRVTGLDSVFAVHRTREAALEAAAGRGEA
jgi:anti-sigma B factor antagonist